MTITPHQIYPRPKAAVCILGMHRSGTSCLAGSLQHAGLQLGEVVESAPYNRKGNREHLDIRALNDAVLATSGGAWDRPPEGVCWSEQQAWSRDQIVERITALPGRAWGFKDPRSVLTFPFWAAGVAGLRVVATFRHPVAVARSLAARDALPFEQSLALWLAYNSRIVASIAALGAPLVSFDAPRDEYLVAVERAAQLLGLESGAAGKDPPGPFFEEDLRHHAGGGDGRYEWLPHAVESVYRQLNDFYRRSLP